MITLSVHSITSALKVDGGFRDALSGYPDNIQSATALLWTPMGKWEVECPKANPTVYSGEREDNMISSLLGDHGNGGLEVLGGSESSG